MGQNGEKTHNHRNEMGPPTSTTLILGAREKGNEAWSELVASYSPTIYNYCRSLGLMPEEAADVSQEVLAAAYVSIEKFRREKEADGFRKWLRGITRHKTRDFFRQQRRHPAAGVGGSEAYRHLLQLGGIHEPSSSLPEHDSTLPLRRALTLIEGDFQPHSWQAFWRTAVDGLDAVQVAAELGMTHQAVRKAKSRVMQRLREVLDAERG